MLIVSAPHSVYPSFRPSAGRCVSPSLLDILSDELQRNFTVLKQKADPPPYYMDYTVTDEESQTVSASIGHRRIAAARTICGIWM